MKLWSRWCKTTTAANPKVFHPMENFKQVKTMVLFTSFKKNLLPLIPNK
jgi:hypothetical protein